MRINAPKSTALGARAFGEYVSPKLTPTTKFSFATSVPWIAPTMDMPTLSENKPAKVPNPDQKTQQSAAPELKPKAQVNSDREEEIVEELKKQAEKKDLNEQSEDQTEEAPEEQDELKVKKMKLKVDYKAWLIRSVTMISKFMALLIVNNNTDATVSGDKLNFSPNTPPEGPTSIQEEKMGNTHNKTWADTIVSLNQLKKVSITDAVHAVDLNKPQKLVEVTKKVSKKALAKLHSGAFKAAFKRAFPKGSLKSR